jgi:uncharacterized coiled-coil protein SlyX
MINDFIELITDETDIETVAEIAYQSDPDPTGLITRGEAAAQVAQAMQYGVYAQLDAEAEVLTLQEKVAEQERTIEVMQKTIDETLSKMTNLTRVLHAKGLLSDLPDTGPHVRDKEDVPHEGAIPDFYGRVATGSVG